MATTQKALPSLSFEFFPPHTPEAQPAALALGRAAGAAGAALRLGDLRGRRHHARPHQRGDPDDPRAGAAERGRAPDLRRARAARRRWRWRAAMRGWGCGGSWRCAAIRPRARPSSCRIRTGSPAAAELVAGLRAVGDFEIAVGAYPEVHPEAASAARTSTTSSASSTPARAMALTQFFFDNEDFLRFRDACAKAGITAPIHPGILPVENFAKMVNFAGRCKASVPEWMHKAFARAETPEEAYTLSVAIACEQIDGADRRGGGAPARLYAEQPRPDLRRLPDARVCGGAAGFAAESGGAA